MFQLLFGSPEKKLLARYKRLLKEARDLQRAGKIPEFARKSAEADRVGAELAALRERTAQDR